MLVAFSRAFDVEAIDKLLFLHKIPDNLLVVSGDGVLQFARLIAADLATFEMKANNAWQLVTYAVRLTPKGELLINGWLAGDRVALTRLFSAPDGNAAGSLGEPQIVLDVTD